jgi:hypothetical protein
MRFGKKAKLNPRFIGPFEITQRVGKLAYRIALPSDLVGMHNVFHVSMLTKYIANLDIIGEVQILLYSQAHKSFAVKDVQVRGRIHRESCLQKSILNLN